MIGLLPEKITIGAEEYEIRSDYRNVLSVFEAFQDPDMEEWEKWIAAIKLLIKPFVYADDVFEAIENGFDTEEAAKQIMWFISAGKETGDKKELPIYDWMQDEQMIFSAINEVAGKEVREVEYMHWWTLSGYFNEISDKSSIAFVMGIRHKMNKKKKLEKYEQEYVNNNKESVTLKKHETKEELEEKERQRKVWEKLL